jgi:hypothetical protein
VVEKKAARASPARFFLAANGAVSGQADRRQFGPDQNIQTDTGSSLYPDTR